MLMTSRNRVGAREYYQQSVLNKTVPITVKSKLDPKLNSKWKSL